MCVCIIHINKIICYIYTWVLQNALEMGILVNMKILVILNIVNKCCNYLNYLIRIRWLLNIFFWFICFFLSWVETEETNQVQVNIVFALLLFFKLFFLLLLPISKIFLCYKKKASNDCRSRTDPSSRKPHHNIWVPQNAIQEKKIFSQLLRNSIYCYFIMKSNYGSK